MSREVCWFRRAASPSHNHLSRRVLISTSSKSKTESSAELCDDSNKLRAEERVIFRDSSMGLMVGCRSLPCLQKCALSEFLSIIFFGIFFLKYKFKFTLKNCFELKWISQWSPVYQQSLVMCFEFRFCYR